jgi:cytoskeletal protein CcmA (bactofilin family)
MSDKNIVSGKHTLVEEGTELKGTISSKCPIVVMGKVEGEVAGPVIHVSPTGIVAGKVKVTELRSAGEVAGEIEAETVKIAGRVRDKTVIRARTLEVTLTRESGGTEVTFGECELAVGDEPNKQAAIDAALAPPPQPAAAPAEPAKSAKPQQQARRKGASEASWDEAASATTNAPIGPVETEEDGTPRKRKTTPPPMS